MPAIPDAEQPADPNDPPSIREPSIREPRTSDPLAGDPLAGDPLAGDPLPGDPPAGGPLALVGGSEWTEGCDFDADLWERSGKAEVLVLPTAAAYERPARSVERAVAHFAAMGARARGLPVLARGDAEDEMLAAEVAHARFLYLSGGSPLHLRSVLKDSRVWTALVTAWSSGAVVAGSAAGAMVLGDPMVDPRGGALTLGLGLFGGVALVPRTGTWSPETAHRTVRLARGDLHIAAVDPATALIWDEGWRVAGAGGVTIYAEGHPAGLEALVPPTR